MTSKGDDDWEIIEPVKLNDYVEAYIKADFYNPYNNLSPEEIEEKKHSLMKAYMELYLKKRLFNYEKMSPDGETLTIVTKPGGAFGVGKKTKQVPNPALSSFNKRLKMHKQQFVAPYLKAKTEAGRQSRREGMAKKCKGLSQENCKKNINDCHWKPPGAKGAQKHPLDKLPFGCYPVKKTKDFGQNIHMPTGQTINITPRALSLLYENEDKYSTGPSRFDKEDGGERKEGGRRRKRKTKRRKRKTRKRKKRRKRKKKSKTRKK